MVQVERKSDPTATITSSVTVTRLSRDARCPQTCHSGGDRSGDGVPAGRIGWSPIMCSVVSYG